MRTSGVKALLIDEAQKAIAEGHADLTVQRPHPMWSEQDPASRITACEAAIDQVRRQAPKEFAALWGIGVSGQMHGATLLDENDAPLRPAILWNDGRAHAECSELEDHADFCSIGGNIVMAGFTAPKLRWVQKAGSKRMRPISLHARKRCHCPVTHHVSAVRVAGGGSQSQTWLQMIADITGLVLTVPQSGSQGAALGAARLEDYRSKAPHASQG